MLHDEAFKTECKMNPKDFTRDRKLPFARLALFMLNLVRKTLQVELDRFFALLGLQEQPPASKQAFSKARMKLSAQTFIRLKDRLVEEFYADGAFRQVKGYRLLGIDGSTLQLPTSDEITAVYGGQPGASFPMARASVVFDVENEITLDAILAPYVSDERVLALEHLRHVAGAAELDDIWIFDMGYPAFYLMAALHRAQRQFVVRIYAGFCKEVDAFLAEGAQEGYIEIDVFAEGRMVNPKFRTYLPELDRCVLPLRIVVLDLPQGSRVILLTSLLDSTLFTREDLGKIYRRRWPVETQYDLYKNVVALEDFTGLSSLSVAQDFHATVLACNINALIINEVDQELEAENALRSDRKHAYKANRNLSIAKLKDNVIRLLLDEVEVVSFYEGLKQEIKRQKVPIRPGRSYPRKRRHKSKYSMNKKRAF